jgi:hypothetical protein
MKIGAMRRLVWMMGLGRELYTVARISMALLWPQYAKGDGTTAHEGLFR